MKENTFPNVTPYIIAEIGLHHHGSLERAIQLIDLARRGGANAVKFQLIHASQLYSPKNTTIIKLINKNSLKKSHYSILSKYSKKIGIDFSCTAFSPQDIDFLQPLVRFYKIASCDIDHKILLRHVAKKQKPVVMSTGGANMHEVKQAYTILQKDLQAPIVLLHCIISYPTPPFAAKLKRINLLKKILTRTSDCVGYSDHTLATKNMTICTTAFHLGAQVIEKHFTDNRTQTGFDHEHSMEIEHLQKLMMNLKNPQHINFTTTKEVAFAQETEITRLSRRSIVSKTSIPHGEKITLNHLCFLRPQSGIPANQIDQVLGCSARHTIARHHFLQWDDLIK